MTASLPLDRVLARAAGAILGLSLLAPWTADARVSVVREDASGVELAWSAGRGDGREAARLALPPDVVARIGVAPGAPGAVGLSAEGYFRRLRFVDVALDADALPPGPARERIVRVDFVAGAGAPQGLPPAVRVVPWDAGEPAPLRSAEGTGAARRAVDDADAASEMGMLSAAGFANAATARESLREVLARPETWPGGARAVAPGELRLSGRRPLGAARATRPGGPSLPGSGPGTGGPRPASFGAGRVKFLVGPLDAGGRGGDGIYRITGQQLEALGVDLSGLRSDELRLVTRSLALLSNVSVEVALRVEDGGDGLFDSSDWFQFWGRALVDENVDFGFQGLDYTDVNAYFLDAAPGPRLRMAQRDATASSPPSPDYLETVHVEENDFFLGNHRTGEYDVDHYYWCGPQLLWQTGDAPAERAETIAAEGLRAGSARQAALRVRLLARTSGNHVSEVLLDGTRVSLRTGAGYYVEDHVATGLPASSLLASNEVRIRLPGSSSSSDRFELDWIELDYPRGFVARNDRLDFHHEPGASVRVAGFSPAVPTVLDVTDEVHPVELLGVRAVGPEFEFEASGASGARYAVAGLNAPVPTSIEWVPDPGLSDPSFAVDVVLFGPRAWLDPPLPGIARWIAAREAAGLVVLPAPIEDVIDEFEDGLFSPVATGFMLVEAFATWRRPPSYALFLGDATLDWKDDLHGRALQGAGAGDCVDMADPCVVNELAWCQHVPTRIYDTPYDTLFLGYYASDPVLSMVSGSDFMPDVALGRIPARTGAEAEALLDKVLAYEQLRSAPPAWASRIAACADEIGRSGEEIMETAQDAAYSAFVDPHYARTTYYLQSDYIDHGMRPVDAANALIADLVQRDWPSTATGAAVLSYAGHGNSFRWSGYSLLSNRFGLPPTCRNDADDLEAAHVPAGPLPVVLNCNCITGSFIAQLGPGLLEELVREPNGGAIAAIGPTGITDLSHASAIMDGFFAKLYGPDGRDDRLGTAFLGMQEKLVGIAVSDPTELFNNVLLGDPTLRLVVPFGPPALILRARGGDSRVDLDWDSVPGAASYGVYRATSLAGPWTSLASGVTGVTYADLTAVNGIGYFYAIEPVDAAGYPGRWSNRAEARPCTFDVPGPASNLRVSPQSCGTTMTVTWSPSTTLNLRGYLVRVYVGTDTSGSPARIVETRGTFTSLIGLVAYVDYTVTLSAITWCAVESSPLEASARITCAPVLDPPAMVDDLLVTRNGTDLVLSWSAVTRTVGGSPLTPALYRVYRSADPAFFADASTELPSVGVPGTTDPSRVGAGASLEFYAVAAESASGSRGPVAHDFPQGVRNITQAVLGTDYDVRWSATTHDMHGERTPIGSYLVYTRGDRPFADRSDVVGITPRRVTGTSVLVPVSEGDWHLVVPEDVHGNQSVY